MRFSNVFHGSVGIFMVMIARASERERVSTRLLASFHFSSHSSSCFCCRVIGCQLVNEGDKISVFGNLLHSTLSVPVEDVEYFEVLLPVLCVAMLFVPGWVF